MPRSLACVPRSQGRWSSGPARAAGSSEQLLDDPRVRGSPTATTADRTSDREVAGESGFGGAAGVGAAIMAGHDLKILMPRAAVAVFVLDAGIREPDVPIVVRQVVFTRPPCNLFRLTVRPAVAVLLAAITLVQESLIVALQLVVEDDAPNPTALAAETALGALVGAIDAGIVRQLAWLPEAGPERLTWLVRSVTALVPVGLEQVPAAIRQRYRAIIGAER